MDSQGRLFVGDQLVGHAATRVAPWRRRGFTTMAEIDDWQAEDALSILIEQATLQGDGPRCHSATPAPRSGRKQQGGYPICTDDTCWRRS